jgi:hypothetical protein
VLVVETYAIYDFGTKLKGNRTLRTGSESYQVFSGTQKNNKLHHRKNVSKRLKRSLRLKELTTNKPVLGQKN